MNLARNFARNAASLETNLSKVPGQVCQKFAMLIFRAWRGTNFFFFKYDLYLANFLEILHRISILPDTDFSQGLVDSGNFCARNVANVNRAALRIC